MPQDLRQFSGFFTCQEESNGLMSCSVALPPSSNRIRRKKTVFSGLANEKQENPVTKCRDFRRRSQCRIIVSCVYANMLISVITVNRGIGKPTVRRKE